MNKKIQNAINKQIQEELYSSYLYLAMAAYAKREGYDGLGNWFEVQSKEENDHAMGFYNYILDNDGEVQLGQIDEPPKNFNDPLSLFQEGLKHEQHITSTIHQLYELGLQEKDYTFVSFVKWYLDEQLEEEATARKYIDKAKLIGADKGGMYMLDQELAQRSYTPASILESQG